MMTDISVSKLRWSKNRELFCLAFFAGLMVLPGRAGTINLPAASYNGSVGFGGFLINGKWPTQDFQTPGIFSVTANPSNIGTATASISTQPLPQLSIVESVTAQSPQILNNSVQSAGGGVAMGYYIEFSGPTASVPIMVNALMSASVAGNTGASAVFSVENLQTASFVLYDSLNLGVGPSFAGSSAELRGVTTPVTYVSGIYNLADSGVWVAQTNTEYLVRLSANASSDSPDGVDAQGNTLFVNSSGTAFVDPTFQIASSVSDPQDYSISISDGIGNTPAASSTAPEPASSALLIAGLGVIGWTARRRWANA